MSSTRGRRVRLCAGLVIVAAITGGCRVDVGSEVEVERSGAGSISVAVTADDAVREALAQGGLGDLGEALFGASPQRELPPGPGGDAFADLRSAGWDVVAVAGGVRMSRRFEAGEDLGAVVTGLGGGAADLSPIQVLEVEKRGGFPSDNVVASGEVGLTVDALVALGSRAGTNTPTQAELEDVLGTPLADLVVVRFHLALPGKVGEVDADPAPADEGDLTWELRGGRQLRFAATSSFLNGFVVWTLVVLAVVIVGAAVLILWRRAVVVRRRRVRRPPPRASSRAPTERIRPVPEPRRR